MGHENIQQIYANKIDLQQTRRVQQTSTIQGYIRHTYTSADTIRQQEQDNVLPHVSTPHNPLYTNIIPQPYYLTQTILFILTEQSKSTERSIHIPAP